MSELLMVTCCQCDAQCPGHKWGKIKGHEQGWFFGKDGLSYCPNHTPAWVEKWRQERGR